MNQIIFEIFDIKKIGINYKNNINLKKIAKEIENVK